MLGHREAEAKRKRNDKGQLGNKEQPANPCIVNVLLTENDAIIILMTWFQNEGGGLVQGVNK